MGEQVGQLPTVMIDRIFYYGHKIVKDFKRGIFDKKMARQIGMFKSILK